MPNELPVVRSVAAKVHPHFPGVPLRAIEQMLDAGFWASLRREEGFTPAISFAYLTPEQSSSPILFERRLALEPESLARLAPAVERPGIHLGVSCYESELTVWGATRPLPMGCFVLEVIAPGLLVVKQRGHDDISKFANIAVLEGDQAKILSSAATAPPDSPPILKTLLGLDDGADVLVELAVSMRKHRRGGALLVVPSTHDNWRESIVHPMTYQIAPGLRTMDVETIAGLTAVDGATIITDKLDLLSFGAKIARREAAPRVDQVGSLEIIEGAEMQIVHPSQLGGTRHLSAAQFAQDQQDAVALVASQDGRFTVFAWSPALEMVQAHRVEAFLL
jgi:hypothetical protein